MKNLSLLLLVMVFLFSCDRVKQETKHVINKSGETVGKASTEFFEGVSEGVDKTLQCEIVLSEELKRKGLQTGKFSIESDSAGGSNNMLTLYLIFNKPLKDTLLAKAFDKTGLEIGRAKAFASAQANDAKYIDFKFDKRTYIEVRSKITIE